MEKRRQYVVLATLTVLIVAFLVVFTYNPLEMRRYDITLSKVSYNHPKLNVTLKFNEDVPFPIDKLTIWYQGRKVGEQQFTSIQFNEGDTFTALLTVDKNLSSNETLLLQLHSNSDLLTKIKFQIP